MEVEQPVFLSDKVTTSFSTQSGATMLVSVCDAVADQDKQEQTGENTILVIMTANVIKANASKAP
jgi:hypothetical protein